MKSHILFLLVACILSSCSKISQERLEGTWKVKEIKEKSGSIDVWNHLLDSTEVKVAFLSDASVKTFYFEDDSLVSYSSGAYLLFPEEEQLVVSDTSLIFNSHGLPLKITGLKKKEMTLEGKYYLNGITPALPADSFALLEWTFEQ